MNYYFCCATPNTKRKHTNHICFHHNAPNTQMAADLSGLFELIDQRIPTITQYVPDIHENAANKALNSGGHAVPKNVDPIAISRTEIPLRTGKGQEGHISIVPPCTKTTSRVQSTKGSGSDKVKSSAANRILERILEKS